MSREVEVRLSAMPRGTPLGRGAGLVGMGLLFAGFNTGNNLFYLLFTVLASLELVGFLVSGRALRRLEARAWLPGRARAGSPFRISVTLTNRSSRLPVPAMAWTVRGPDGDAGCIRTPALEPGGCATGTGHLTLARRGRVGLDSASASTDFPLGLVRRRLSLELSPLEVLVEPSPLPGPARRRPVARGEARVEGPTGRGDEPVEAREYVPGDDARGVDWKASARLDRLMWRERRGSPPRAARVRLDRSGSEGQAFEKRVSRAAGAVIDALSRGETVGFETDEWSAAPRSGDAHRRRILDYLALVRPRGATVTSS